MPMLIHHKPIMPGDIRDPKALASAYDAAQHLSPEDRRVAQAEEPVFTPQPGLAGALGYGELRSSYHMKDGTDVTVRTHPGRPAGRELTPSVDISQGDRRVTIEQVQCTTMVGRLGINPMRVEEYEGAEFKGATQVKVTNSGKHWEGIGNPSCLTMLEDGPYFNKAD
ncbi:MAG TPA: hypothetical protein VGO93_10260 [Candidatus Xenobia bacterium]|jgi:hypothetical protein